MIAQVNILKSKKKNFNIFIIELLDPRSPTSSDAYIELKTSRIVDNPKSEHSFQKFKLLKFWAQSFIGNVPNVVVGFRDDNGIIQYVKTFQTLKIPSEVKEKNLWVNFFFLIFLKKQTNDYLSVVRMQMFVFSLRISF